MSLFETQFSHPYSCDPKFSKRVAYFSMEFAIDQSLKVYSGGLGFLAGSHMRSAFELKQNLIGIGILWKYGYYDQIRQQDQSMNVLFQEKIYSYLQDTGIKYTIDVNGHPVWVTAKYLPPQLFNSVPMFFLTTDLPENDYLARSMSFHLYDADLAAKVAQFILLGVGGAKLLDELGYEPDIYHLNEAHGLAASFYLYQKFKKLEEVRKRLVFTTHTPEEAGNEKHDIYLLNKMGYFCGTNFDEVRFITGMHNDIFDYSQVALRFAKIANGVSALHSKVAKAMWSKYEGLCPIISITNSQNYTYWGDKEMYDFVRNDKDEKLVIRKKYLKMRLFETVADQAGDLFSTDVLTLVWARRFAGYKRAELITQNKERFERIITNKKYPVQIIWAGKPYPMDYGAISTFNSLVHLSKVYPNISVLVGYELKLSKKLKYGADIWLNNPRVPREASGTSGMTACMNGAINFSTQDGWIPEYANDKNSFLIPLADQSKSTSDQDAQDLNNLYDILENKIIPMYYERPAEWLAMMKRSMLDVLPYFESNRMAEEYYEKLYNA